MSASLLLLISIIALLAGYLVYARYVAKILDLDDKRVTPAHTQKDGIDYMPARMPVLMGHHFAAIAGAAPIIGPIIAASFGWLPVLLWIILGCILIGGVHDFTALVASVRHGGKTIGRVIEEHIGLAGKRLFLVFAYCVVLLVVAAFCDTVAGGFISEPAAGSASLMLTALAVLFGLSLYRSKMPFGITSVAGILLVVFCIVLGLKFPFITSKLNWQIILFIYVIFASITPVWILLQPRGYLSSFLLYGAMILGITGIFLANPTVELKAFTTFNTDIGQLFPILFVVVACGAISGLHALIATGTTSRQLDKETDAKPVAYASMLIEGLLAVIALITVAILTHQDYIDSIKAGTGPLTIFANGMSVFSNKLGVPIAAGKTFAILAIATFALTTMDSSARLARYIFEEFFEGMGSIFKFTRNRYISTLITIVLAALLMWSGTMRKIWPLYGTANQLLASLTLLALTLWMAKTGKKNLFLKIPMFFMFTVTIIALVLILIKNVTEHNILLSFMSVLLLGVAISLIITAIRSLKKSGLAAASGK